MNDRAAINLDDAGPAFPWGSDGFTAGGLSIRDWFAGQALAGICAHEEMGNADSTAQARWAYSSADAMIAARSKGGAL